jgi:hypothetical protein
MLYREQKTSSDRSTDVPRDRPHREGCEHANLERPGAQAHPVARGWQRATTVKAAWRLH